MGKNFKEIPCPFCSRIIRSTDKFCIFCGSKIQQSKKQQKIEDISEEEEEEIDKELEEEKSKKKRKKRDIKKKDKKEKRIDEEEEEEAKIADLPEEIKKQLEAKMELAVLSKKKERLRDKFKSLTEDLDKERYDYDLDYKKKVNRQLDAIKQIKEELFKKEEELRSVFGDSGQFRMDKLRILLNVEREQLIELKRNYKRHKIKKDIYKKLKKEHVKKYNSAEEELEELQAGVIQWLSKIKMELSTYQSDIEVLKARNKIGEIEESFFKSQKQEIEKKIEECKQKINILELYTETKRKGFFR